MVNEEILSGLKSALERGKSLKSSMTAFLNSGYRKEEIEEAARALAEAANAEPKNSEAASIPSTPADYEKTKKQFFKKLIPEKKSIPVLKPLSAKKPDKETKEPVQEPVPQEIPAQKPVQKNNEVSYYGKENPKEKILMILLLSSIIFLFIALVLIFIFRKELINFFSDIFAQ